MGKHLRKAKNVKKIIFLFLFFSFYSGESVLLIYRHLFPLAVLPKHSPFYFLLFSSKLLKKKSLPKNPKVSSNRYKVVPNDTIALRRKCSKRKKIIISKKGTNFTITFLSPDLFFMMSITRPSAPILVCSQQHLVP